MSLLSDSLTGIVLKNGEDFYFATPFYIFAGLSLVNKLGWKSFIPLFIFIFTNGILTFIYKFYLCMKKIEKNGEVNEFYFYTNIISVFLFLLGSYVIANFIILNHNEIFKLPKLYIFDFPIWLREISSNIYLGIAFILHIEKIKIYEKRNLRTESKNSNKGDNPLENNSEEIVKVKDYS